MKNSHRISLVLGFFLALLHIGCSARPTEQEQAAQKAMDQAKEQRAEQFAANEWNSAQQAWAQAQESLSKEKYAEASSGLLRAKSRFERARDVAKGRRDDLLKDIQGTQKGIELRYKGVQESLKTAKLPASKKQELEDSCKEIEKALEKLKGQLEQGDYNPAKFTADTTFREVWKIEQALQGGGKKGS